MALIAANQVACCNHRSNPDHYPFQTGSMIILNYYILTLFNNKNWYPMVYIVRSRNELLITVPTT